AALLAHQDPDGQWAGGAYFPADFDFDGPEAKEPGQPYTATTWPLNALRDWGLDAAVLGDSAARLDANSRWEYEQLPYWGGEVDCCIHAFTLANGTWLGA
ncbi:squalene cyclase, partial [Bacillus sp. S34]|nr:squalene cyclase [Bacillus sp. S34]